jgi:hypothetical protein
MVLRRLTVQCNAAKSAFFRFLLIPLVKITTSLFKEEL